MGEREHTSFFSPKERSYLILYKTFGSRDSKRNIKVHDWFQSTAEKAATGNKEISP